MTALEPIADMTEIELMPPARAPRPGSVVALRQHVAAMADAKMLADALCDTEMVPAAYRGKAGNAAAAILLGMELGLEPIQSLQNIFVVGGKPAMYARTAVALVKAQGIVVQTVESSDQAVTVSATDPRTGQVETSTWDLGRAERAGYLNNKKYNSDPQAMLYAKAAMEVCRKIAPDVLMGIPYAREELEMEATPSGTPRVVSARRGVDGLRAAIAPAPPYAEGMRPTSTAPVIEPEIVGDEIEEDDEEREAAKAPTGMAPATRRKWEARLAELFADGEADSDDQPVLMRELLGLDHTIDSVGVLTDDQLRDIVNTLNAMAKVGSLAEKVNDILNAAALTDSELDA